MKNWKHFNDANNRGASRNELLKIAQQMTGSDKAAALRILNPTKEQRRESVRRTAAINMVSDKECRAHCQFNGLPAL